MSPQSIIYYIIYVKQKFLWSYRFSKYLYKTGSHLAWVNGINGTCRSRWLHTIAILPLKGKFFSSSHSEVQPQIRATVCNWNCWGNVCKQHFIFQWVGRDCTAEFTQKLQIDIIQQLKLYFHWSISTFTVQYGNIFLKNKMKQNKNQLITNLVIRSMALWYLNSHQKEVAGKI